MMHYSRLIFLGFSSFLSVFLTAFFSYNFNITPITNFNQIPENENFKKSKGPWAWSLLQPIEAHWHPIKNEWLTEEAWKQPKGWRYMGELKQPLNYQLQGILEYRGEKILCVTINDSTEVKRFEVGTSFHEDWIMESLSNSSSAFHTEAPVLTLSAKDNVKKIHLPLGAIAFHPSVDTLWENTCAEVQQIPLHQKFKDYNNVVWKLLDFCDQGIRVESEDGYQTICYQNMISLNSN